MHVSWPYGKGALFGWRVATIVAEVDRVVLFADAVEILCIRCAIQDAVSSAETIGVAFYSMLSRRFRCWIGIRRSRTSGTAGLAI